MNKILKFPTLDQPPSTLQEIQELREQMGHGSSGRKPVGRWSPMAHDALDRVKRQIAKEGDRYQHRISYRNASDRTPLNRRRVAAMIRRLGKQGIAVRALRRPQSVVIERRGSDIPPADVEAVKASTRSIARYLLAKRG